MEDVLQWIFIGLVLGYTMGSDLYDLWKGKK
jgi:hypothetical protein